MTLYFTDSIGNKTVVAENVQNEQEGVEKILAHQRQRHIHYTGSFKIKKFPNYFSFTTVADESPYILER